MKKIWKRIMALMGAAVVCVSMVGCSMFSNEKDLEGKLAIVMLDAGYGTKWMEEIVEKYQSEHPDVEIDLDLSDTVSATFESSIKSGPRHNEVDLYIVHQVNFKKYGEEAYTVDGVKYDSLLEDLSEVYDTKIPGEDVTLEEKMKPEFREFFMSEDGKYYAFPLVAGPSGFIYNVDVLEANKVKWGLAENENDPLVLPATTDDFLELIQTIYQKSVLEEPDDSKKIYPFIWTGSQTVYWNMVEFTMFAQYEGYEGYKNFWQGKDSLGRLSPEGFASQGKLELMNVLEGIVMPRDEDENYVADTMDGYCYQNSIELSHYDAQTYFMDGKAAFTVCGNWLEREMEESYERGSKNIAVMKTPVLSAAEEKWKDDPEMLEEIRSIQYSTGPMISGLIPTYSEEKELAKDFLLYLFKDENIELTMKHSLALSPYTYTPSQEFIDNTTTFQRSQIEIDKTAKYIFDEKLSSKLFYRNDNLNFYPNNLFPVDAMTTPNLSNRQRPYEIWETQLQYVRGQWPSFIAKL